MTDTIEVNIQNEQKQKVTQTLSNKKVLASKRQAWVAPGDNVLLADDPDLERMFTAKENVHFLTVEPPKAPGASGRRRPGGGRGQFSSYEFLIDITIIWIYVMGCVCSAGHLA